MSNVNTLIKWPGGKAREIKYIDHLIPKFNRYVEPFFGGGAMFFYLQPQQAIINDISKDLMDFYSLAKVQDKDFYQYLMSYHMFLDSLMTSCDKHYERILDIYQKLKEGTISEDNLINTIMNIVKLIEREIDSSVKNSLVLDNITFEKQLVSNAVDKMERTVKNEQKAPFTDSDLKENLITGFTSGTYMYFRDVYNDIILKRQTATSVAYNSANFYFIREYCYGSMFRYNSKGEFNIPYGGMSYNKKNFKSKIDNIFSQENERIFKGTDIYCLDFEQFFSTVELNENDFMFLDPPYDTDFSDYEGKNFTRNDQQRLAEALKKNKAKFILIIKNTDFIYSLYENHFNILCFDKTYTYNVRSRNERNVEHLIITNMSI